MKKISGLIIMLCMLFSLNAYAAQNEISVTIDGKEIEFDVEPQIINDYTMVPMRAIFENLGYEVEWYDATRAISAVDNSGNMIEMIIDNPYMYVGNDREGFKRVALDIAPQIVDERTLVPVRAIAEADGCKVRWDGETRTVIIYNNISYYPGTDIPDIESLVPDAEFIGVNDGTEIHRYELDYEILSRYIDILETQYGFTCLEDSLTSFTMCPKDIIGYSLSIDIVEEDGYFALTPWEYVPSDEDKTITEEDAETIIDILEKI